MKFFAAVLMAAIVTVSLAQETTTTTKAPTTTPVPTSSSTPVPTSSTTKAPTTSAPTTSAPTTHAPTTQPPTTQPPTTQPPTTPSPAPVPEVATKDTYVLRNGDKKVCAVFVAKVVATQNSTRYPFVNGTLVEEGSTCNETQATLMIQSVDNYKLQIVIETKDKKFFIESLSVQARGISALRDKLEQFSTPTTQYYKCAGVSQVSLEEQDVNLIFSEMSYQAFRNADTADFVGTELECVSDQHSDVVIIAIGCALALLVVVILIAYLIARRKNRQRGYQSV